MIKYFCDICLNETTKPTSEYVMGPVNITKNQILRRIFDYDKCNMMDNVCSSCGDAIDEFLESISR